MTENSIPDAEAATAAATPFPGTPKRYLKIAIWGSIAFHAYLFVGYWAIKRFLAGEAWPQDWFAPTVTLVSTVLFARQAFKWIMRLDAQYGRGSGWLLESTSVKLPFEKPRRK